MFKPLVIFRHKLLRSNDARIRKIARTIPESINPADFKILFALFCNNFILNDLCLHFVRAVYRTGFIDIPAISSDPLFFTFETLVRRRRIKFLQSEIGRKKAVPVAGLYMEAK